jgi:two-component system, LytTR family, response regulator
VTSPIRAFVAEDEPLACEALVAMTRVLPGWVVVGQAGDGRAALEACLHHRPDVLLTDIRMPLLGGLELVTALRAEGQRTHVVFITAHDVHAVAAFKLAAVDYLLKPVADAEFRRCVERLELAVRSARTLQQVEETGVEVLLRQQRAWLRHLVVRSIGKVEIVPLDEVTLLRAEGNYVSVVTPGRTWLHRETVKSLTERLDPARFVQVHRSVIVAVREVRSVERTPTGTMVHLAGGESVPVGPTFVARLHAVLER